MCYVLLLLFSVVFLHVTLGLEEILLSSKKHIATDAAAAIVANAHGGSAANGYIKILQLRHDYSGEINTSNLLDQTQLRSRYGDVKFLHIHIKKTGGSTFERTMRTNGTYKRRIELNCNLTFVGKSAEALEDALMNKKECNFISYEFKKYNETLFRDLLLLTLVREPLATFMSMTNRLHDDVHYPVDCRHHPQKVFSSAGKHCRAYYQRIFGAGAVNNFQVSLLGDGNLTKALYRLRDEMFWFGITEHYDLSICLLVFQMGLHEYSACKCFGNSTSAPSLDYIHSTNMRIDKYNPKIKFDINSLLFLKSQVTALDNLLYSSALSIFFERVAFMEHVTQNDYSCRVSTQLGGPDSFHLLQIARTNLMNK